MQEQRWAWLRRWYLIAGIAWFARYATLGHIPLFQPPLWRDWFDQGHYLASAVAFSHGDLSPGAHWYPLGYAVAAAPFAWILPSDPFFLLDLLLFLLACKAFQNVAGRLGIGVWTATICFLATTIVQTGLAGTWAHPWNTTLSATLIWWLIDRTLLIGEGVPERDRSRMLLVVGALAMSLPLVRPVDALVGLTCVAVVAAVIVRRRQLSLGAVAAIGGGAVTMAAIYGGLHLAIYGPHPTAYMIASARTGFIWSDLGWKAYVLLVHADAWFPGSTAMLERLPWLVPGCAGLIVAAIAGTRRERKVVLLLFALIVPTTAVMLTYADLQPPGLWYFGNIHYFKWGMPAFGAGVVLFWRQLQASGCRRLSAAVLVALLLPLTLRIVPVPVDDRTPARMLWFEGDVHRDWQEAYFAPVAISDDRGRLDNVRDFHQVPDTVGERAIAISRLFGRHPRRSDPGEHGLHAPQLPYARFAERYSFLGY